MLLLLGCAPHPVAVHIASAPPVLHAVTPMPLPTATLLDREGVALPGDVRWSTADPTIARIEGTTLIPLKNGTTMLVARSGGAVGEWAVKVAVPTRITVTSPDLDLVPTQRVKMTATPYADDEPLGSGAVVWSSSDEAVLRVDKFGQADALKGGDVQVNATLGDAVGTLAIHVQPDAPPVLGLDGLVPGGGKSGGIGGLIGAPGTHMGTGGIGARGTGGTIAIDDLHVGAGSTRELVEAVLKRTSNQLRYCYQRELTRDATLSGRVSLAFDILADGTISAVGVTSSTIPEAAVTDCQVDRFTRFKFPVPTQAPAHVTLTLVMTP